MLRSLYNFDYQPRRHTTPFLLLKYQDCNGKSYFLSTTQENDFPICLAFIIIFGFYPELRYAENAFNVLFPFLRVTYTTNFSRYDYDPGFSVCADFQSYQGSNISLYTFVCSIHNTKYFSTISNYQHDYWLHIPDDEDYATYQFMTLINYVSLHIPHLNLPVRSLLTKLDKPYDLETLAVMFEIIPSMCASLASDVSLDAYITSMIVSRARQGLEYFSSHNISKLTQRHDIIKNFILAEGPVFLSDAIEVMDSICLGKNLIVYKTVSHSIFGIEEPDPVIFFFSSHSGVGSVKNVLEKTMYDAHFNIEMDDYGHLGSWKSDGSRCPTPFLNLSTDILCRDISICDPENIIRTLRKNRPNSHTSNGLNFDAYNRTSNVMPVNLFLTSGYHYFPGNDSLCRINNAIGDFHMSPVRHLFQYLTGTSPYSESFALYLYFVQGRIPFRDHYVEYYHMYHVKFSISSLKGCTIEEYMDVLRIRSYHVRPCSRSEHLNYLEKYILMESFYVTICDHSVSTALQLSRAMNIGGRVSSRYVPNVEGVSFAYSWLSFYCARRIPVIEHDWNTILTFNLRYSGCPHLRSFSDLFMDVVDFQILDEYHSTVLWNLYPFPAKPKFKLGFDYLDSEPSHPSLSYYLIRYAGDPISSVSTHVFENAYKLVNLKSSWIPALFKQTHKISNSFYNTSKKLYFGACHVDSSSIKILNDQRVSTTIVQNLDPCEICLEHRGYSVKVICRNLHQICGYCFFRLYGRNVEPLCPFCRTPLDTDFICNLPYTPVPNFLGYNNDKFWFEFDLDRICSVECKCLTC